MRCIIKSTIYTLGLWGAIAVSPLFGQSSNDQTDVELKHYEATLKKASVKLDNPSLLNFFTDRTLSPGQEQELKGLVLRLGHESYAQRALAMNSLLDAGSLATPFLKDGLKADDEEVVRRAQLCLKTLEENSDTDQVSAAAYVLSHRRVPGTAKVLLKYLPFATDDEAISNVREALKRVAVDNKKQPLPEVVAALNDSFAIRRAAAGEALANSENMRKPVVKLLDDPDTQVRFWVALALLKAEEPRSVPVLIDLLGKVSEDDVWQVEEALIRLAGESSPSITLDRTETVANIQKAWKGWLKGQGKDIGKLLKEYSTSPAFLNYTLVTEMPQAGGANNGTVMELGPKKDVRWKINGLRYPVDALVTGHNRVLVVEYFNRRLIEFDFQGKVIWSKGFDQPIGVQRMSNGNLFVTCRRKLVEITRTGKQVFSHSSSVYIAAAHKKPNGEIIMVLTNGQLKHLDAKQKVLKQLNVGRVYTLGGHIEVLPNGNVLVPEYTNNRVGEYNLKTGQMVKSISIPQPTSAIRLPNGRTLVSSYFQRRIVEVNSKGQIVWNMQTTGRPWCARRR